MFYETPVINFESTTHPTIAYQWLQSMPSLVACDFETTGLLHPSLETITHFSIATSPTDAKVMIFKNPMMERTVMHWLTTTLVTQVWHNLSFDSKFIHHRTGKFPHNYEDTQLLAWTLLNHVDTYKAKTGLKELMGYRYGDWAVSADSFNIESMDDPKVTYYAAVDACATYQLWLDIQEELSNDTT